MDCFSVSVTCGIMQKKMGRQVWAMAFLFGLFQGAMPLIGWLFSDSYMARISACGNIVAFALLAILGLKMLREGFKKQDEGKGYNPSRLPVLLLLALATSIDAFAVGISFTALKMDTMAVVMEACVWIAFISFVMSLIGKYVGVSIGRKFNCRSELIGGVILLIIAFKVLLG